MAAEFVPGRLTLARRRRALTKGGLATKCGLSVTSVSSYERGQTVPTAENVIRLAKALEFPVAFFSLPDPPVIDDERISFRSLRSMTALQQKTVKASGEIAIELDKWIDQRFDRPAPTIPDLRATPPEIAATAVRAEWGLGYRSIHNMIHLLELHGARVYSLAHESRQVDAFSLWWGELPFVFLNTVKSAERSRFDAAHELGHLVLHRHGGPRGREAESEADRFASEFLMPKADVIARAPRWPSDGAVIKSKQLWGVSAMALVYRMHVVGMLSDHHYHQLCIRLRSKYGSEEPEEMPRESSQSLAKVFAELRRERTTRADVARALNYNPRDIRELLIGLVLVPVAGGGRSSPPSVPAKLALMS